MFLSMIVQFFTVTISDKVVSIATGVTNTLNCYNIGLRDFVHSGLKNIILIKNR